MSLFHFYSLSAHGWSYFPTPSFQICIWHFRYPWLIHLEDDDLLCFAYDFCCHEHINGTTQTSLSDTNFLAVVVFCLPFCSLVCFASHSLLSFMVPFCTLYLLLAYFLFFFSHLEWWKITLATYRKAHAIFTGYLLPEFNFQGHFNFLNTL